MKTINVLITLCILMGQNGVLFTAREGDQVDDINANLPSDATSSSSGSSFQDLVNEAKGFFKTLTDVNNASNAIGGRLSEFKNVVEASKDRLTLPKGWDKQSLLEVLNKAVNQNSQFQELNNKFSQFMANLQNFDKSLKEKSLKRLIMGSPLLAAAVNQTDTTNNASLAGKLAGIIRTGRLGSLSLSEVNLCSNGACDKLSNGFQDLKNLFSGQGISNASASLKNFFHNPSDSFKKLFGSSGSSGTETATTDNSQDQGSKFVDYFDYYYHVDSKNQQPTSTQPAPVKTNGKHETNQTANGTTNAGNDNKPVDYFDLYYSDNIRASGKRGDKSG